MTPQEFVDQLLAIGDYELQQQQLENSAALLQEPAFGEQVAALLKQQADHFLRADLEQSRRIVALLFRLAEVAGNPLYRALGLRAEGNILAIGQGEHLAAIACYDQAAAIYRAHDLSVQEAESLVGKLVALDRLGRHQDALELGQRIAARLDAAGRWLTAANTHLNLFGPYDRLGRDEAALAELERAGALYQRAGAAGLPFLPLVELNRAILLRNRGRLAESLTASATAERLLLELGQPVEAARARQASAITCFVMGRYNEALQQLDEVVDVFWRDGRHRDAMLAELYLAQCLLELGRLGDVLARCRRLRRQFAALETHFEAAQAVFNEAIAYAGLHRYAEALASLDEARAHFAAAGNQTWVQLTDIQRAAMSLAQGQAAHALPLALECAALCQAAGQPVNAARAHLVAAQAAAALRQAATARQLAEAVLDTATAAGVPALAYQAHAVLGALARAQGDTATARREYECAIQIVEKLQSNVLSEFRADFIADKNSLYETMVQLCLDTGAVDAGLNYAERAKSRALLDLLAYRLDLSLRPRSPQDAPLVAEILQLRAQLSQHYRRAKDQPTAEALQATTGEENAAQQTALALEQQIAALWHKLLLRNSDYRREAALWQVQTDALVADLPPETALLEFFSGGGQWLAFIVTPREIRAQRLSATVPQLQKWLQLWQLNLKAAAAGAPEQGAALMRNARGMLGQLYRLLLAPLQADLEAYPRWLIVPHGLLHYVPFHALHDGADYVIARRQIAYLPSASVLPYCAQAQSAPGGEWVALGHSHGGRLPYAVQEAQIVAELGNGRAYLEEAATLDALRDEAAAASVLHLAVHGDFRPDNPLFSGLALADTMLTTLDVFNLRLRASLVTLSACQTGRSVVGGGDELLGLMRAFLYAGAASLVLSLWSVADASTLPLMRDFYGALRAGATASAALQYAQIAWLERHPDPADPLAHPYHWAPFFLVGTSHAGKNGKVLLMDYDSTDSENLK